MARAPEESKAKAIAQAVAQGANTLGQLPMQLEEMQRKREMLEMQKKQMQQQLEQHQQVMKERKFNFEVGLQDKLQQTFFDSGEEAAMLLYQRNKKSYEELGYSDDGTKGSFKAWSTGLRHVKAYNSAWREGRNPTPTEKANYESAVSYLPYKQRQNFDNMLKQSMEIGQKIREDKAAGRFAIEVPGGGSRGATKEELAMGKGFGMEAVGKQDDLGRSVIGVKETGSGMDLADWLNLRTKTQMSEAGQKKFASLWRR
jgi:hypothetical protein